MLLTLEDGLGESSDSSEPDITDNHQQHTSHITKSKPEMLTVRLGKRPTARRHDLGSAEDEISNQVGLTIAVQKTVDEELPVSYAVNLGGLQEVLLTYY